MSLLAGKAVKRRVRLAHRNAGIVLSVFLLLFVVTGLLLNHTTDLGLADRSVPGFLAARYYDVERVSGFVVEGKHFYRLGETLYLERTPVTVCAGDLSGAAATREGYALLCDGELAITTEDGELIERLGRAHGLPSGLEAIAGTESGALQIRVDGEIFGLSLDTLATEPVEAPVQFPSPQAIDTEVLVGGTVSWEQFLLDLHSGKYVGRAGVWLWDLIGLFLVILAVSGVVMFLMPRPDNGCRK